MLNISFLACTQIELWGPDSLYCGKWRKHSDLDLGTIMHNIELVQDIFIYNNVFKFHFPRLITF